MKVSEFKIGRGEVYVNRYGQPKEFIEVINARGDPEIWRTIMIATHLDGKRVPHSERIVFSATQFLAMYRPATPEDFRPSTVPKLAGASPRRRATAPDRE